MLGATLAVFLIIRKFYQEYPCGIFQPPNDAFNNYSCSPVTHKWEGAAYWPEKPLCDRVKACASGKIIPGCVEGFYYHSLSVECKNNPQGIYCKGKGPNKCYDPTLDSMSLNNLFKVTSFNNATQLDLIQKHP